MKMNKKEQPKLMTKIEVISQKPSKTGFLAKMANF